MHRVAISRERAPSMRQVTLGLLLSVCPPRWSPRLCGVVNANAQPRVRSCPPRAAPVLHSEADAAMSWRSHGHDNDSLVAALLRNGVFEHSRVAEAMRRVDRCESHAVSCNKTRVHVRTRYVISSLATQRVGLFSPWFDSNRRGAQRGTALSAPHGLTHASTSRHAGAATCWRSSNRTPTTTTRCP